MDLKEKPRLALIGHSFHQKTRSHDFLVAILEKRYCVSIYWDESWQSGAPVDINAIASQYDTIVFFQIFYKSAIMKALRGKNVTIMPMHDAVAHVSTKYWKQFSAFKFFCFCRKNYSDILKANDKALYLQYYPPVQAREETGHDKPVVYFWQRVRAITWHVVRELLDPDQVGGVIINQSTDPGHKFVMPSNDDIARYRIEFVSWLEKPEDHFNLLKRVDIFIAPRPLEGIGFSFLNAMARGKVILAANLPTANEYITNTNGYLYELDRPQRLDLSGFREKAAIAHQAYCEKAGQLPDFEKQLLDFVEQRSLAERIRCLLMFHLRKAIH